MLLGHTNAVWRLGVWRELGCVARAGQDHEEYADQSEGRDQRPRQTGPFEQRLDDGLHHRVGYGGGPDR
jgi:hypothetical protein